MNKGLGIAVINRFYCKTYGKPSEQKSIWIVDDNWRQLKFQTKIPLQPVVPFIPEVAGSAQSTVDSKTIQLIERLSLVDLDRTTGLKTLKDSILFADRIVLIDTADVKPLYSLLEEESLQLREDIVADGNCRDSILKNAKLTDEDYFVAPPGNIPLDYKVNSLDEIKKET